MRVAFFDSTNKVINILVFADGEEHNFEDFYGHLPNITNHKVLESGEVAGIGLTGTQNIVKPFPSWTWNESDVIYMPPSPYPEIVDRESYYWDEPTLSWKVVTDEMKNIPVE